MDNNEEKNIPTNDFEIIDIPNTLNEDNSLNNNQFEQLENNMPVEQINVENIQPSSTNVEQINNDNVQPSNIGVEQIPAFDVQQSNLEQPTNSYNELNSNEPVYSDVQQPIEPIDTREINNETPISYNELGDSTMNSSNQQLDNLNNAESVNNYIPINSSSNNQEENKGKLDQSVKELITMGVIVAVVVALLPILYNVSTGKYNITNNIKNTVSNLFSKSSSKTDNKKSVNENKSTATDSNDDEEEQTTEDLEVTFDFTKYNNQVLDNVNLNALLEEYKNYLILLNPTVENGIQTYKIQIAKDVKSAGYSISDPEQAFKEFSAQYLQASANYLITITNDNDNVTTIIATRQ